VKKTPLRGFEGAKEKAVVPGNFLCRDEKFGNLGKSLSLFRRTLLLNL
jgi:hypothetical protein